MPPLFIFSQKKCYNRVSFLLTSVTVCLMSSGSVFAVIFNINQVKISAILRQMLAVHFCRFLHLFIKLEPLETFWRLEYSTIRSPLLSHAFKTFLDLLQNHSFIFSCCLPLTLVATAQKKWVLSFLVLIFFLKYDVQPFWKIRKLVQVPFLSALPRVQAYDPSLYLPSAPVHALLENVIPSRFPDCYEPAHLHTEKPPLRSTVSIHL